ncbi:YciI family protein [Mariniluteicoccus endophyticus]
MPTYAVHYTYIDDADRRQEVRPAHREFLGRLAEDGICLVAGAYAPAEEPGGLLVFRHESKEGLAELLKGDPFQVESVVTDMRILEWGPAVGPYASHLA